MKFEDKEWWRGAVIYQIYPRSFKDSSGNGIGDLKGITEKLDYVASLGVDGIWLSPFFTSPMKDFGYDVSDYKNVDPIFGTIEDFQEMLDKAHSLDLKIIIDQVLNHTSDQHPWFLESKQNRDNPRADWYVWADPKPDGTPPNNWQSIFGGPAWTFNVRRGQYYMHNFLTEQPELNLRLPHVRAAVLNESAFWLEMGVDGFRLDTANFFYYDPELKDNPPNPNPAPSNFNIDFPVPYTMQLHEYDKSQPDNVEFLKQIRQLMDRYDNTMTVGEICDDNGVELSRAYTSGKNMLHTAYNFSLISGTELSAKFIRESIEEFEEKPGDGWPSWAFSNHDVVRIMSRWGGEEHMHDARLAKLLNTLLGSLRGTAFYYQGEELGLPNADIPYDRIQDPWGYYLWPEWQGRDGCRTPMPWNDYEPNSGFSACEHDHTWLPIPEEHYARATERQDTNDDSVLNFTRNFLSWRKKQPALQIGDIQFLDPESDTHLYFTRKSSEQEMICIFNLSSEPQTVQLHHSHVEDSEPFEGTSRFATQNDDGSSVELRAFGFYFGDIKS